MSRVIVELPLDRGYCGRLSAFDESGRLLCGPFAVAARAGDVRAQAEGNPKRNPLLRYGDTPTGSYRVTRLAHHEARAQQNFGPHGVLVIEATAGDAALAEANGRYRLFIQGGAAAPDGSLRSTAGSLRLSNSDVAVLIAALGEESNVRVDVVAHEGMAPGNAVFVDNSLDEEDPPQLPGAPNALRDLFGEVSRRDALRAGAGGAAGLTALSLAVSFVSLGTPARAEVYTRMAYNDEPTAGGTTSGGGEAASGGSEGTGGGAAAPASSALDQLKNATSGSQTTGQTFDNGSGPSDATPTGNLQEPPTPTASPVPQPETQEPQTSNTPVQEPNPPAEQEPTTTTPAEPSPPPEETSSPPETPSSPAETSPEPSESNSSSSSTYSAPSYSAPEPSTPPPPPPSRRSVTVIDIFPAGPTPQPGQKPPGQS